MTTIAYRDGILAADSKITYGGAEYVKGYHKIWKSEPEGIMVGFTGDVAMGSAFKRWALNTSFAKIPDCPLDLGRKGCVADGIIVIKLTGGKHQVLEYNGGGVIDWGIAPFLAWGSGWLIAVGALEAGVSAEQAVTIAARRDVFTGGKIHTLSFNKPKRKGKR